MTHLLNGDVSRSAGRLLVALLSTVFVGCGSGAPLVTPPASLLASAAPAVRQSASLLASAPPMVTPSASLLASAAFQPAFRYTLPAGWTVTHDLAPLFRFLPTGFTNDQFDAGMTDAVTLISSVTVSRIECDEPAAGIGVDPDSIAAELLSRPGLVASKHVASVGGLPGLVLDIRLDPKWTHPGCGGGAPGVALIHGPTYDQGIGGKTLIRIYLAPIPRSESNATVAIEADDQTGGDHIGSLTKIVTGITFVR